MSFPNVTDIVATTIESRSKELADNVTQNNALLTQIKANGGVKTISGGSVILEEIAFAANGNAGWYSGYDTLPSATQDVLSAAQYGIKQAAVTVAISGLEELQNSGREAFIDLLEGRLQVAESSLSNLINQGLYSDGTGASGKQITGLAAAVAIVPTTGVYGGIDRSVWSFWQNKKLKGSGTDYAGALTIANVGGLMTEMFISLTRANDKPNLIIMGATHYQVYLGSLQPQQRFTDSKLATLGFDNVKFMSAPVVMETVGSGIGATTSYFLNTKFLKFRPHADRNMVALDPKKRFTVGQDAETQIMAWAGNLTCRGAQFNGVISD